MRNRLEMDGLREQVQECCEDIATSWIVAYNLNPEPLKQIQQNIQDFAISNRDMILSFYDFAKQKGCYKKIEIVTLMDIMTKYESYHDELMTFIRAATSSDWRLKDDDEAVEYIQRAVAADETFTKELFEAKPQVMVFPEALQELDIFIAASTFIDKVYDNFIFFSNLDLKSEKVKHIISLYEESTIGFLRKMGEEIPSLIEELSVWVSTKRVKSHSDQTFRLI